MPFPLLASHPTGAIVNDTNKARIFISYKRNVNPDEPLCTRLHAALEQAGHDVFVDKEIDIGVKWAAELERQIKACDFIVVLLSAASVQSEMVEAEIRCAHRHHEQTGKSRLLPVRVNYFDPLPYQLSAYLDPLQYAAWHSTAEDESLVRLLRDAIQGSRPLPSSSDGELSSPPEAEHLPSTPSPYADPRFVESLREPSGAIGPGSRFYVEREGDERLRRELCKPSGTTTTIRAPRQTGKSSLLFRGIAQAKAQGCRVAFLDLQLVSDCDLQTLDTFLWYFVNTISAELGLDPTEGERIWQSSLGAPDKTTRFFQECVLARTDERIVLSIDEADRLLRTGFHDNFFGLLRSWHNRRALNSLWEKLDIVMVISTEPHLLISDVTQSPFNVGATIRLQDFTEDKVRELNERYHSPLNEHDVPALMDLLGGHPYLTHKALYLMVTEKIVWDELTRIACTESGPFGDHLLHYLWLLRDEPQLTDALKRVITDGQCLDQADYYRLLRAGLIRGPSKRSCTCRCQLYEMYLKDRL